MHKLLKSMLFMYITQACEIKRLTFFAAARLLSLGWLENSILRVCESPGHSKHEFLKDHTANLVSSAAVSVQWKLSNNSPAALMHACIIGTASASSDLIILVGSFHLQIEPRACLDFSTSFAHFALDLWLRFRSKPLKYDQNSAGTVDSSSKLQQMACSGLHCCRYAPLWISMLISLGRSASS